MAEGNASLDQLTKTIERTPPVGVLKRITASPTLESPSYSNIQLAIQQELQATINRYPTVPPERIRSMFMPYFGPFLLREETHILGAEKSEQKELSARIQHSFVELVYNATQQSTSERFTINMYDYVRKMQSLCELSDLGRNYNLLRFWNGVKAELAIVRALRKDKAFDIILPDYMQDPAKTNIFDNEVLQWDVNSGVDLIAIPKNDPSQAILIDVKGRKRKDIDESFEEIPDEIDTVEVIQRNLTDHERMTLNSCLRGALDANGIKKVSRVKITIPTAGGFLGTVSNLPQIPLDGNYKGTLEQFTSLRPDLAESVRQQLLSPLASPALVAA